MSGDTVAECTHFVAAEVPERQHVIMLGSFVPALQLPVGRVCVCAHVYVCHMYVVLNIVHHTLTQDTVHICTYVQYVGLYLSLYILYASTAFSCVYTHTYVCVHMYVCLSVGAMVKQS